MDDIFRELVAVDHEATGRFFGNEIGTVVKNLQLRTYLDEAQYVASVLANFAQVSCDFLRPGATATNLSDIFDRYVIGGDFQTDDVEFLEEVGAQTLLLCGFFRQQMKQRHNVFWYDGFGSNIYQRASVFGETPKQKDLYWRLGTSFQRWARICALVHKNLNDNRYVLRIQ